MPGAAATFEFINSSGASIPNDPGTRIQIRRQAMSRAASARRQRGNYGKKNLRQFPVLVTDPEQPQEADGKTSTDPQKTAESIAPSTATSVLSLPERSRGNKREAPSSDVVAAKRKSTSPPIKILSESSTAKLLPSLPTTGYESMRSEFNFDVLDLSGLTTYHIGRPVVEELSRSPSALVDLLKHKPWSYFSYVPQRIGQTACLDDAVRCVLARVCQCVGTPGEPPTRSVLAFYSKALKSLQAAIDDPELRLHANVLCATEVLAIYELLDNSRKDAWIQHTVGAIALIKLRGPQSFPTSYEKALFLAQAGPIFTEAMLNNCESFLDQDSWQILWRSIIEKSRDTLSPIFADENEMMIRLWTCMCSLPTIFRDIQNVVCNSLGEPDAAITSILTTRAQLHRSRLLVWHDIFQFPLDDNDGKLRPGRTPMPNRRMNMHRDASLITLMALILLSRLLIALEPASPSGAALEESVQSFALEALPLQQAAAKVNPRVVIFLAFNKQVAEVSLATKSEWRSAVQSSGKGFVAKDVFEGWCRLMGRTVRSDQ